MVTGSKLNQKQIEDILLSFQKAAARYPSFQEFCSHGKRLLPSTLPFSMSPAQKEKLRQKVKYIITKQKKIDASLRKQIEDSCGEEVYMDDATKQQIENNASKDAITHFKEVESCFDSEEALLHHPYKQQIENNAPKDAIRHFKEVALSSSLEILNQKKAIAILHQIILKEGIALAKTIIARKSFDQAFSMAFDMKLLKLLELRKLL
jgi:hypothetical protein